MGLFDGPLFDFNGDGKMDMLEFLAVTQNDPTNPMNESDYQDSFEDNCDTDDYDLLNDDFDESDYDY